MIWLERIILPFYYLRIRKRFLQFQEQLFDWHCNNFFDFRQHLTGPELDYIQRCMKYSNRYRNITSLYSFYSYSHCVNRHNGEIDSSRLAYGLLDGIPEIVQPAQEIARGKGMDMAYFADPNCIFYGIGWDFSTGVEKIYFRYHAFDKLVPKLQELAGDDRRPFYPQGIISVSYRAGHVTEEKLYRFTRYRFRRNYAILFSAKRCVEQHNIPKVFGAGIDKIPFSAASIALMQRYKTEQGLELDTYAIDPHRGVDVLYFDY